MGSLIGVGPAEFGYDALLCDDPETDVAAPRNTAVLSALLSKTAS